MKLFLVLVCLIGVGMLAIGVGALVMFRAGHVPAAPCEFRLGSLLNASGAEIQAATQAYVCSTTEWRGEPPVMRFFQRMTPQEYIALFGDEATYCKDQTFALVVFEGDFADLGIPMPLPKAPPARYVMYLFDLRIGAPTTIRGAVDDDILRKLQNDPTLPERKRKRFPTPAALKECRYEIAPTVLPSGTATATAPAVRTRMPKTTPTP